MCFLGLCLEVKKAAVEEPDSELLSQLSQRVSSRSHRGEETSGQPKGTAEGNVLTNLRDSYCKYETESTNCGDGRGKDLLIDYFL